MLQQLREDKLETEKASLVQQVEELIGKVAELSSEKELLHDVSRCFKLSC